MYIFINDDEIIAKNQDSFESSLSRAICNAVYPKKRTQSCKGQERDPSIASQTSLDDIGIRMYRNAVEKRNSELHKGGLYDRKRCYSQRALTFTHLMDHQPREYSIMEKYAKKKENLKRALMEKERETKRQCTFRPKLSTKTVQLAKQAKSSRAKSCVSSNNDSKLNESDTNGCNDVFNYLYLMKKKQGKVEAPSFCTFRPKISRSKSTNPYYAQPITSRLINAKKEHDENLKKAREKRQFMTEHFDSKTGQMLYNPKISRGPKNNRQDKNTPIFEKLHKDTYFKDKKTQLAIKAQKNFEKIKNSKPSLDRSKKLLEIGLKKKCEAVFKLLDPDGCGSISKSHINLTCKSMNFDSLDLSSEALDAISSLLLDIEKKNLTLNVVTFTRMMSKMSHDLIKTISAGPKQKLDEELSKTCKFSVIISF